MVACCKVRHHFWFKILKNTMQSSKLTLRPWQLLGLEVSTRNGYYFQCLNLPEGKSLGHDDFTTLKTFQTQRRGLHVTQMRTMVLEYLPTKLGHFWDKCR